MNNKLFVTICLLLGTLAMAIINLFGLMRLIPMYITIPLLFIFIYLTIFTFTYRNMYRGTRHRRRN